MGQLGFIFFSLVGVLVAKDGIELAQLAQVAVPILAEMGPLVLEAKAAGCQAVLVEMLPQELFS